MYQAGNAVVQAAFVVNHLRNHPAGSGATNNEYYIVMGGPVVPKMAKHFQKAASLGAHPWQLIYKNYFFGPPSFLERCCFSSVKASSQFFGGLMGSGGLAYWFSLLLKLASKVAVLACCMLVISKSYSWPNTCFIKCVLPTLRRPISATISDCGECNSSVSVEISRCQPTKYGLIMFLFGGICEN
jgi:hypothetical protein